MLKLLIGHQNWDLIDDVLTDATQFSATDCITPEDLIIHYACQYNAPLRTIVRLSTRLLSSLNAIDDDGRYPIHVAVLSGCMPDVIRFFLRVSPATASVQDKFGKTPMHYAAECYAENYLYNYVEAEDAEAAHDNARLVVEMLIAAAPQSVNVEDEDGMNPIELAVINSAHIKVVKMMQTASRKDWRRRTEEEEEEEESNKKSDENLLAKDTSSENLQDGKSQQVLTTKPILCRKGSIVNRIGARGA